MILSRGRPFSKATGYMIANFLQGSNGNNFKQAIRSKSWVQYRNPIPPDDFLKEAKNFYKIFSAALWWWIIWRLVSEWEELVGPPIPKMSDWTDEELGIPPLDEDI